MEKVIFSVEKRAAMKPRQLRVSGKLPANMYQSGKESVALQCGAQAFTKLYDQVGDTGLVYLSLAGEKELPVLIDEVQYNYEGRVIHVVFRKVNLKEKIKAEIPVELVGEFAVDGAVLVLVKDSVEVEALPTDLPEKFEIDQSKLTEIGQVITLADLHFDQSKVELVLAEGEMPESVTLVSVQEQREEEVEEPVSTEVVEPERVGEKPEEAETASDTKTA